MDLQIELIEIVESQNQVIKSNLELIKELRIELDLTNKLLNQIRQNQIIMDDELEGIKAEIIKR